MYVFRLYRFISPFYFNYEVFNLRKRFEMTLHGSQSCPELKVALKAEIKIVPSIYAIRFDEQTYL